MLKKINHYYESKSSLQITSYAVILVILIGCFDYLTGYEVSFSIFYLAPIAFATWYTGSSITFFICSLSAITWFLVDNYTGHLYSHQLIPFWNGFVRLGFFIIMAKLLMVIKKRLKIEEQLARHDGLTGLLNARTFLELFSTFFDLAKRHNHYISLAYLDLDNFKTVNDTLGHLQGDQVLIKLGAALSEHKRNTDFAARLGGDEFAILLPETDSPGSAAAVKALRDRLTQIIHENNWPIGFSIGVATFKNTDLSASQAISYADNLMYQVKKKGKNNIRFEEISKN